MPLYGYNRSGTASQPAEPTISSILQSLPIYRDKARVSHDSATLLRNPAGTHLRPRNLPLTLNNGTSHPNLLLFHGTVSMMYKSNKYNIPVEIFLLPAYPVRPPVCFVRPVESMIIKENHRHVGSDGMVYMPYLHGWKPHSHNLVDMVNSMSGLFGDDPPVFRKPTGTKAPAATASARPTPVRPPRYDDVARPDDLEAIAIQQSLETERKKREEQEESTRLEEELERVAIMESASLARESDQMRKELTTRVQRDLSKFYTEEREKIKEDLWDQTKLERSGKVIKDQISYLNSLKEILDKNTVALDNKYVNIQVWLEEMESSNPEETLVDDLALPVDMHSVQMLSLSAESAAIADCLYFLDKGLVKGTLPLDVHLKRVRMLAKRQFLVKAHLIKIAQAKGAGYQC